MPQSVKAGRPTMDEPVEEMASSRPAAGVSTSAQDRSYRLSSLDLLLVALATLLGAALRWYQLDAIPPGFYHDEAINGLAGIDIRQGRFFMLYGFDVREPLFHWLVAGGQLLWGNTVLAVRSASALAGTLAVPALYLLGVRMFNRWVAACASFGLALSVWHFELSRFGVRGVMLPLLAIITCYFFWRGLRGDGGRRTFALAGLFLGLTAYTYISARAVPLLFAAFVLWQVLCDRPRLRALLRPYLLALLVAAAVFAPLGYTYLTSPELFGARSAAVSLLAAPDASRAIAASALRTLGMLVVAGDPNLRHNVAGRPVFDLVGSALFLLGLAVALRRWRQPAYAFCLLWLCLMLLPGILSIDSPHFIRTLGAAPAAFLLLGLGVVTLRDALKPRLAERRYAAAVALWLVALAVFTSRAYFQDWARSPAIAAAFEANLSEPARYLAAAPPGPAVVFFPDGYTTAYPQVFQYLGGRPVQLVAWYDGNDTMLLPERGQDADLPSDTSFLVLGPNPRAEDFLRGLPGIQWLERRQDGTGAAFDAYRATQPVSLWQTPYDRPLGVVLGGQALLEGYSVVEGAPAASPGLPWQTTLIPGGKLVLRVHWRVLRPAEYSDLRLSFQLVDAQGHRRTGVDLTAYPSGAWRGGERLLTWVELPLPSDLPPGKYEVRAGAYSFATQASLPVADEAGNALGDSAPVVAAKVRPGVPPALPAQKLEAELSEGIKLLGYDLRRDGQGLHVILLWEALRRVSEDYTVFLHLADASGHPVAQQDGPPSNGTFPTSYWEAGDVVRDERVIRLDAGLPSGKYVLLAGMYDPATGRRLPSLSAGDAVRLGEIALP